ncbi:hypothetical protein [Parendozoicomonas haliclonae]|uniref:Peptidase family M50 n=1 Tax=Parendozoicomonas haliclonae TaxID=1960125 RepID=A0A1X7AIV7_9GAMM|nr:hypothetical protein [Parendozoicomonas haliclonae]SMA44376.1 hypothetical protein EHSB41UT_01788 [Parendozoicomonas haliclonae]
MDKVSVVFAGYFLGFAIIGLLVMPLMTFLHELGHALPILASGNKAHIVMGTGDSPLTLTFNNLKISLSPTISTSFCYWEESLTQRTALLALIAGPLTSLLISMTCIFVYFRFSTSAELSGLLLCIAGITFFQFLFTAIPMHYPSFMGAYAGAPSDGYQILQRLK